MATSIIFNRFCTDIELQFPVDSEADTFKALHFNFKALVACFRPPFKTKIISMSKKEFWITLHVFGIFPTLYFQKFS